MLNRCRKGTNIGIVDSWSAVGWFRPKDEEHGRLKEIYESMQQQRDYESQAKYALGANPPLYVAWAQNYSKHLHGQVILWQINLSQRLQRSS